MTIGVLDAASIPWVETFVGGGVAMIGAAVSRAWQLQLSLIA